MAKEPNKHPITGEFIDSTTWRKISDATKKIAESGSQEYRLTDSFLWASPLTADVPDQKIGIFTEAGDLETGKTKFIWFDDSAEDVLMLAGEDNLKGQIEFSRQIGESYLYGALKLYEYHSGEGDVELFLHGHVSEPSDELGFELNKFALGLGLSRQFQQVYELAGELTEQQIEGNIDRHTSWNIAHALQQRIADLN